MHAVIKSGKTQTIEWNSENNSRYMKVEFNKEKESLRNLNWNKTGNEKQTKTLEVSPTHRLENMEGRISSFKDKTEELLV